MYFMITEYSRTYLTGIFRDHEIPLLRYAQNAHGRGVCGQWDFWDARCRLGYGGGGVGACGGLSEATAGAVGPRGGLRAATAGAGIEPRASAKATAGGGRGRGGAGERGGGAGGAGG